MSSKSNNVIFRTNPTFWKKQTPKKVKKKHSHRGTNTKHSSLHTEKKTDSVREITNSQENPSEKVTHIASHSQFNIEKKDPTNTADSPQTKQGSTNLVIVDSPQPEENNNRYKFLSTAIALCLCLALLPFIKNINQTKNNDIQASHPVDHIVDNIKGLATGARETEKKRLIKRYETNNQQAVHVLKEQRRLASIGKKPDTFEMKKIIQDKFSHGLLQSRYKVKWRRHKLRYLNILKGEVPLDKLAPSLSDPNPVKNIKSVIRDYSIIFPKHESIQKQSLEETDPIQLYTKNPYITKVEKNLEKNGFSVDRMETYTLKNKDCFVATVAVFTDNRGRLLAMYVQ